MKIEIYQSFWDDDKQKSVKKLGQKSLIFNFLCASRQMGAFKNFCNRKFQCGLRRFYFTNTYTEYAYRYVYIHYVEFNAESELMMVVNGCHSVGVPPITRFALCKASLQCQQFKTWFFSMNSTTCRVFVYNTNTRAHTIAFSYINIYTICIYAYRYIHIYVYMCVSVHINFSRLLVY